MAASLPDRGADGLGRYRAKRDFARTPEPSGGRASGKRRRGKDLGFVVQKHAARRLHHDLRLELDGVLKSWAVPQGPSLDPAERRLAVQVEDHPLAYGGFEGTIPEGEYGGGTVMLWDRGAWEPVGDPAAGHAEGKLKFHLRGTRLQGGWTLVRMGGKAKDKDLWLLVKERDEHAGADEGSGDDRSVLSGRTMEEIAADPERVWHGDRSQAPAAKPLAKRGRRSALPFVPPQLASLAASAPAGQEWLHEIKHDGYRVQLRLQDGEVALLTRNGHDWTHRFRELPQAAQALQARSALLDGEVVVLDEHGVGSFARLKAALSEGVPDRLLFYAFDLLHLDGHDLRALPLLERKRHLQGLLASLRPDHSLRFCDHLIGGGPELHRRACRLGAEGIVAKRVDAPYRSGRREDWLKVKCHARQEFVIGGYTTVKGRGLGLGSLLLGVHRDGVLAYVGRVGTGWDARAGQVLRDALDPLRVARPPFARLSAAARRGARWVRPELVAEVRFQTWTEDGMVRHASFQGLREDRTAAEVVPECPGTPVAAAQVPSGPLELHGVRISSADRPVLDRPRLTKGDVARYYAAVADLILPHVAGRPLSVIRCPERLGEGCFYQRHRAPGMPASIRTVQAAGRGGKEPYLAVDDAPGLMALVQFGAIELHPNGARADRPDRPDRLVFDLDPAEGLPFARVVAAAHELKERLQQLGLASFARTTGGKGLHLVVPLERRHGWPEAKAFAGGLARAMQADSPKRYTAVLAKAARQGRIFVDYLRNDRAATAVASYSLRGRARAPVALPLSWDKVTPKLDPLAFTVLTVPGLVASRPDPWAGIARQRQRLPSSAAGKFAA